MKKMLMIGLGALAMGVGAFAGIGSHKALEAKADATKTIYFNSNLWIGHT